MNTHAENLLHALIDGLMNATPTTETHPLMMLAAELKGAMQATCDHCETPPFTQPDYPTPDADGWVENTGVMPECEIKALRFYDGVAIDTCDKLWSWDLMGNDTKFHITHYKPA